MEERSVSLDILRAIAIAGMVLSASIAFDAGLPAWMFHAQVPPPDYVFHPEIPGITWVDLVFPFFIFTMGAVIPIPMIKRLRNGVPARKLIWNMVHRWISLSLFSLMLGNAGRIAASTAPDYLRAIFLITVWTGFFMVFIKVKSHKLKMWINPAGWILLLVCTIIQDVCFGMPWSWHSTDIIIMILANLALWGGLIWLVTKDKPVLRVGIWGLVIMFKALSSYLPASLAWIPTLPQAEWLFKWDFLQYLIIIIPATFIGEQILSDKTTNSNSNIISGFSRFAAWLLPSVILLQLWGLYTRSIGTDLIATLLIMIVFMFMTKGNWSLWNKVSISAFILLLVGISLDPADGGIAKDYCNLSYLFTTGGMAMMMTGFLLFLEKDKGLESGFLAKVGQNPMIAYTITGFIIVPLLSVTGILSWFDGISADNPVIGLSRGIAITLLMMLATWGFTKKKIYWRN